MSIYPIYRRNLIEYWRQWYPEWDIPNGFHVHHIVPRSCGGTDNPTNLIALHPDDHIAIHKHRGDKWAINGTFLSVKGKVVSEETRKKRSIAMKGRKQTKEHTKKLADAKRNRPLRKQVCRIEDKKEFSLAHWAQYMSRSRVK